MKSYLLLAFLAFAFTYLATPIVRRVALLTHTLTPVRARDVHTVPIPRLGGVAMTWGFVATMLMGSRFPYFHEFFSSTQNWVIIAGAVAITLLGVVDDIWDMDWWTKLAGQLIIAGIVAWRGAQVISIPLFGVTIGSSRLSTIVSILVIVVAVNAVNFVDGLDGLAAGTIAIGALGFFIYAYMLIRLTNSQSYASFSAMLMIVLVGVCVGFLMFNFHPASIFMGDCGSMMLGYVVGVAFIMVTGQIDPSVLGHSQILPAILPFALPIAVLVLPLLDMVMAVIRRTRAGKTPFHPDRMHLHHRLLRASHSHRRAVLVMYLWSAGVTVGAVSFMCVPTAWAWAICASVIVIVGFVTIASLPGLRARYLGRWLPDRSQEVPAVRHGARTARRLMLIGQAIAAGIVVVIGVIVGASVRGNAGIGGLGVVALTAVVLILLTAGEGWMSLWQPESTMTIVMLGYGAKIIVVFLGMGIASLLPVDLTVTGVAMLGVLIAMPIGGTIAIERRKIVTVDHEEISTLHR